MVDKFSVECSNWVDEGAYKERNLTRDLANGEPLTYLYETLTRRNRATGNETIKTEVFRGGNMTLYKHQVTNFFLFFLWFFQNPFFKTVRLSIYSLICPYRHFSCILQSRFNSFFSFTISKKVSLLLLNVFSNTNDKRCLYLLTGRWFYLKLNFVGWLSKQIDNLFTHTCIEKNPPRNSQNGASLPYIVSIKKSFFVLIQSILRNWIW